MNGFYNFSFFEARFVKEKDKKGDANAALFSLMYLFSTAIAYTASSLK
jgi:hypothetical protein